MIPANGFIKLSALYLYRRLFVVNKWSAFDISTKICLVLCTMWMISLLLATVFGCGMNFDYSWKPLIFVASCNTNLRLEALMVTDLITDIAVWILPIPVVCIRLAQKPSTQLIYQKIWSLAMKTTQKIYVTGILMLGAV
jgi:hypothetical protein